MSHRWIIFFGFLLAASPNDARGANACYHEYQAHHDAYVNGAMASRRFDGSGVVQLLASIHRDDVRADSAEAFQFDLGFVVFFFRNGCAVATFEMVKLPEDQS